MRKDNQFNVWLKLWKNTFYLCSMTRTQTGSRSSSSERRLVYKWQKQPSVNDITAAVQYNISFTLKTRWVMWPTCTRIQTLWLWNTLETTLFSILSIHCLIAWDKIWWWTSTGGQQEIQLFTQKELGISQLTSVITLYKRRRSYILVAYWRWRNFGCCFKNVTSHRLLGQSRKSLSLGSSSNLCVL